MIWAARRVARLVIAELAGYPHSASVQVDVFGPQRCEFNPPEAGESSQHDRRPVTKPRRSGQRVDLGDGQDGTLGRFLGACALEMKRSALARIALLALIWGSAFLWIKLADRGFSPVEVTLARLALGAAVLFVIVGLRHESVPRSGRLWVRIAVAALFANAVPYLLFAVAEQHVASSTAGIINATTPLWTVVLALAVRHQKTVTSWQAAGLIVGFAGAVLIFTPWRAASDLFSAGGVECLAASISYAISYIYMDRYLARRGTRSSPATARPPHRRWPTCCRSWPSCSASWSSTRPSPPPPSRASPWSWEESR